LDTQTGPIRSFIHSFILCRWEEQKQDKYKKALKQAGTANS